MPALLEERPTRRVQARPVPRPAGGRGGGGEAGPGPDGDSESGPIRQWPLVPALIVAMLLAALLTLLGMYTQIMADRAGAQLPGA